jgi:hypothetical protein
MCRPTAGVTKAFDTTNSAKTDQTFSTKKAVTTKLGEQNDPTKGKEGLQPQKGLRATRTLRSSHKSKRKKADYNKRFGCNEEDQIEKTSPEVAACKDLPPGYQMIGRPSDSRRL